MHLFAIMLTTIYTECTYTQYGAESVEPQTPSQEYLLQLHANSSPLIIIWPQHSLCCCLKLLTHYQMYKTANCNTILGVLLDLLYCEPHRSSAYSDDILWHIMWQRHALGRTHEAIAASVNIDVSTVRQILDIFSATGEVSRKAYPAEKAFIKISEPVQLFILPDLPIPRL